MARKLQACIDTNVAKWLQAGNAMMLGRFARELDGKTIGIPPYVVGELVYGALHASFTRQERAKRDRFIRLFGAMPITNGVARVWALITRQGEEIHAKFSIPDSWVAATAIAYGVPLATHDGAYHSIREQWKKRNPKSKEGIGLLELL